MDYLGPRALSNVKPRSEFNHWMCAMIYGSYAVCFKVPYDTRWTIMAYKAPAYNNEKILSQGFTKLHKVSTVHAARVPWQGNQRLRSTANDRYHPVPRSSHAEAATDEKSGRNSVSDLHLPSIRPSVGRRASLLRYIVQARLLRETNGAPLVHSPPPLPLPD